MSSQMPELMDYLAVAYDRVGEAKKARQVTRQLVKLFPDNKRLVANMKYLDEMVRNSIGKSTESWPMTKTPAGLFSKPFIFPIVIASK